MINYTSGTTGFSKGVMIPYRALTSNLAFAFNVLGVHVHPKDSMVSILPMAHMYGMSFEFIFEFCVGMHVYFLTRVPSPQVIFKAFSEIRPRFVISVPLILEKILKKMVLPKLQNAKMRVLMRLPVISQKIREKICEQLTEAFGGRFYEIIIGGAALNQEVETFLKSIGFHYTVGYGATECAPIITYQDWEYFKQGTCGKAALNMVVKIDSEDPENIVGEILAKGPNVMLGYYKNQEATEQTIDSEGWYHTGDLGTMDDEGNVTIRGRNKNMLLGASGQNIYPEEIEDKLNSLSLVCESLIIQKGERFYGLVYPDYEEAESLGLTNEDLIGVMEQNRKELNLTLPVYSQLSGIKIFKDEFEKTPKKSIKRYLYADVEV
jgi:long-chain acyl-CoA synthetase